MPYGLNLRMASAGAFWIFWTQQTTKLFSEILYFSLFQCFKFFEMNYFSLKESHAAWNNSACCTPVHFVGAGIITDQWSSG